MEEKRVKVCKRCGVGYGYTTQEDLSKFFYKKGNWYMGNCKKCDCAEHAEKYAKGEYNYYKKKSRDNVYLKEYSFGSL